MAGIWARLGEEMPGTPNRPSQDSGAANGGRFDGAYSRHEHALTVR
jgi:hypothetical protein